MNHPNRIETSGLGGKVDLTGWSPCYIRLNVSRRILPALVGASVMVTGVYHNPKTCAHNTPMLERRDNRA